MGFHADGRACAQGERLQDEDWLQDRTGVASAGDVLFFQYLIQHDDVRSDE